MKKQTIIKIISRMIISVFLLCLILPITPINAATQPSISSLYSNPNQSVGNNPYKFKVSDVVTGSLLTSVVGCTGVVNKTAKWMTEFAQSPTQKLKIAKDKLNKVRDQLMNACAASKAGAETAAGTTPTVNDLTSTVKTIFSKIKAGLGKTMTAVGLKGSINPCQDQVISTNDDLLAELIKQSEADDAKTFKEQCFDGIAITLAKNQLTAMARSTMNWVNSGYGGNPFFVQNMQNLTYNIEKNVVETGIDVLLAPKNASPYAADFARSTINSQGIVSSSSRFLGGLQSDLSNFISDPRSLYSNNSLNKADTTQDVLLRAQQANDAFARDFSLGGWNGWLALTQREKNNPLGFNMLASQYLSDMQTQAVSDQKAEITQNGGFMSQKECIQWQIFNADGTIKDANKGGSSVVIPTLQPNKPTYTQPDKLNPHEYGECFQFKIITPGSLIKDKVGNYLNSPDRQLELVKTINDGLNVLFSALISKLQSGGLTSLSDSAVATNWTDNMNTLTGGSSGSAYDNNGAYDGFNLTRDLGNTYIHSTTTNLGTWNAKACPPEQKDKTNCNVATLSDDSYKVYSKDINTSIKLYPNTAPEIYIYNTDTKEKEQAYPPNPFYIVTVAGKTKLMTDGYNGWEVGDRAFWDGSKWQNWKKVQQSPIAKRGVIQLQQDYIVAAKDILGVLPNVMTSLGELDYCIPGPNPSYKTNSTDAPSAYQDWNGSMFAGAIDNTNQRFGVRIDQKSGDKTYDALEKIYADNPNVWNSVLTSMQPLIKEFSIICDSGESGSDCTSSYFYKKNSEPDKYQAQHLAAKNDLLTSTLDKVNNHLFQDFYDVFDKMMNKIYFNNMTSQYLDTETSIGVDKNPAYVPMVQSGLDLTKDILYYNDETTQKIQDYTDAVAQAKINIAKLQPIRDEVSGIIKAAQDRRDANLVKILKGTDYAGMTDAQAKTAYDKKYKECFNEEDIQVFDADGILGRGSKVEENCNDGIDNDLNGLTDVNDPACPNYVAPSRTR